jgi:AsmA protein
MKLLVRIGLAALAIVVVAIVAIPFFVHANTFRPMLEARLSAGLGRSVKLGNLRLSVLSGNLVADNLSIADDAAFGATPLLSAREVRIGVDMKPLILHRQVHVQSFEIEAPQIHLVNGPNGEWNFSSLSRNAASLTSNSPSKTALFRSVIDFIAIQEGRVVIDSVPAEGPPHIYDHVHLTMQDFSLGQRFPFELGTTIPGDGAILVKGNIGPLNAQNAAKTAANVEIALRHLNPVAAGFLDPSVGLSVIVDVTAHATSDGNAVHSSGTLHMQGLQLRTTGAPSPQPIDLTYDITHQMDDNTGQVQQASIGLGSGTIQLSGSYRLAGDNPWVDLKVAAAAVPIDELQSLMTAAGVKLPNGSQLKGGTLTLALEVTGVANDLVITGPLQLDNTRLVGFDLGSKVAGIASMGGVKTGSTTTIQTMQCNLQINHAGIQVTNIDSSILGMGRSTGSGAISPAGILSFRLVAHVANAHGMGKVGVGLMTKMNQFGKSDSEKQAANGVPMLVTGTPKDPVITADVNGLVHRNANTLAGKMKHFFGKKDAPPPDPH